MGASMTDRSAAATLAQAPGSLGRRAAHGMLWFLAQSAVTRLSSFASQLVLAWLLVPADFGRVGLALTISNITNALVSFGVDDVLLQRGGRMVVWARTAFWISLTLGCAGAGLGVAAAPLGAAAYGSAGLVGLVAVLAAATAIGSLATVPVAALRAALDFRYLALVNTWEVVAVQGGTVLLAWAGAGAYSFVLPMPVVTATKVAAYWWRARPVLGGWRDGRVRPRLLKLIAGRGLMVTGSRLLTEAVQYGDYIVLGLLTAPDVVGLYFFAFRLAAMPVRTLAGSFQSVMFPALARLAGEPERQRRTALEAARLLAFVVMPLCFLQAAIMEPGLHLLFGAKWEGAIPLAQILSLGLPFDAVSWVAGALLSARGEFRRAFAYSALSAPVFFASVAGGGLAGASVGLALAVGSFYLLAPPIFSWAVFRAPGVGARTMLALYGVPAGLSVLAVGPAYLLSFAAALEGRTVARLLVIGAATALLYPALLRLAAPAVFEQILARVRTVIGTPLARVRHA